MSYIAFHTEAGDEVRLRGWERYWMQSVNTDTALTVLPPFVEDVLPRVAPGHYLSGDARTTLENIRNAFSSGFFGEVFTDHDGTLLRSFSLALNTTLILGSDPVCLMARLHAQCEIHCYVEGPNRAWLADLIEAGRASGLYRDGAGWSEIAELLRASDQGPVVTSESIGDSFPCAYLGEDIDRAWEPPGIEELDEEDEDHQIAYDDAWAGWDRLPREEQWRLSIERLRSRPERLVELSPDNLRCKFGHGKSLIDLFVKSPAKTPA